jgi:hypothetical protein
MVVFASAADASVTVQVAVDVGNTYGAAQLIPERDVTGTRDRDVVVALAFHRAVSWAAIFVETALAVTANDADIPPPGTVTVAGRFSTVFDDDKTTLAPPTGAACASVTVHELAPSEASTAFAHVNALIPLVATTAIAAPVPVTGIALPSTDAPMASNSAIGIVVSDTVGAS